jgi:hypothetical protein
MLVIRLACLLELVVAVGPFFRTRVGVRTDINHEGAAARDVAPAYIVTWIKTSSNYQYPPVQALLALDIAEKDPHWVGLEELLKVPLKLRIPEALYANGSMADNENSAQKSMVYLYAAAVKGLKDAQFDFARQLHIDGNSGEMDAKP